jgi:hypothetical protein
MFKFAIIVLFVIINITIGCLFTDTDFILIKTIFRYKIDHYLAINSFKEKHEQIKYMLTGHPSTEYELNIFYDSINEIIDNDLPIYNEYMDKYKELYEKFINTEIIQNKCTINQIHEILLIFCPVFENCNNYTIPSDENSIIYIKIIKHIIETSSDYELLYNFFIYTNVVFKSAELFDMKLYNEIIVQ